MNVSVIGTGYIGLVTGAFLNAGIGFGGFCFPKNVYALVKIAEKSGFDFALLQRGRSDQ